MSGTERCEFCRDAMQLRQQRDDTITLEQRRAHHKAKYRPKRVKKSDVPELSDDEAVMDD